MTRVFQPIISFFQQRLLMQYFSVALVMASFMSGIATYVALTQATPLNINPDLAQALQDEAIRVQSLLQQQQAIHIARATVALATVSQAVQQAYTDLKAGRFDYDDLLLQARALLKSPEGPGILYQLDGGLRHVLVDEAQDTSPLQWELIHTLVDDFFSGHGQHAVEAGPRTLFVVGDYKQSIYSFQGADPTLFIEMRNTFAAKVQAAQQTWYDLDMAVSFRAAPEILTFINKVFEKVSLGPGALYTPHQTVHNFPGQVTCWPVIVGHDLPEPTPWQLPTLSTEDTPSPAQQLAGRIATQIQTWLQEPRWLHSRQRPIVPSDIMVLVRRRHRFVEHLIQYLKQMGIPVTGVDRLSLTTHINVQDLLALGDFLINPADDLALASVLKSPLLRCHEEQLFMLAYNRGKVSLWQRLQTHPAPWAAAIRAQLQRWQEAARTQPLYRFFQELIYETQPFWPANQWEVLMAFLEYVQVYCQQHIASLPHFLAWMRAHYPVAPDHLTTVTDAVRVLTIHGAKGLQAPIVFLPDTTHLPRLRDQVLWYHTLPVFAPGGWAQHPATAALHAQHKMYQQDEYHRLLYVALTRAEEHLIIGGWHNQAELPAENGCWYNLLTG